MGGGYYEGDVAERRRTTETTRAESFNFVRHARGDVDTGRRDVHKSLNPKGTKRECCDSPEHPDTTPIVAVMDLTASRGKDVMTIFEKMPMFIGQIKMHDMVTDPELALFGIGDASSGDQVPLQTGQFESDNKIDDELKDMVIEEAGGGTGQESYELAAYYLVRHTECDANKRGKKGFCFILGDERPYDKVSRDQVKAFLGREIQADISTAQIFQELQKKFNTYFLYQKKSLEDRKAGIDAEIRQRVMKAGGQYENIDFRASLVWNNRNDLDLHVIAPSGDHIYYLYKNSRCGGYLDVDMNVRGETTKPVENVRWARNVAPTGKYRVFVRNYGFHEASHAATEFRVEIEVNGEIKQFTGKIPANATGESSDQVIGEFEFDPAKRPGTEAVYENYKEDVILDAWKSLLPTEHVLIVEDPRGVMDVMLGVLAIAGGSTDLDGYMKQMNDKGQTENRCEETRRALSPLVSEKKSTVTVDKDALQSGVKVKSRRGGAQKL